MCPRTFLTTLVRMSIHNHKKKYCKNHSNLFQNFTFSQITFRESPRFNIDSLHNPKFLVTWLYSLCVEVLNVINIFILNTCPL